MTARATLPNITPRPPGVERGYDATAAEQAERLKAAAEAVLTDMECKHANSEYGACFDCRNTGYELTCQQDQDLMDGCLLVLKALRGMGA